MPNDYWDMDDKNDPYLLNLASVSTSMLVPFPVGRLPDASLLWLNERWFHDLGMAIHDAPTRARISASLLERFAVTSIEAHCVAGTFGGQTLGADRYGGSGGAIHGGSGRCGSDGMLIAKGTGPTPLVSEAHDWSHSHGCLYLYDAIREAVASEILNAELPHGAVPIVAIIDAGFSLARTDADEPERCAILIRPAFLRLAHFERSLYFGTSGSANSDQFQDSLRVKDAIHFADEHTQRDAGNPNDLGVDLSALYLRLAEQIAASRAHRLWTGRPTSDNITSNAQFLDFGGFRAVPTWKRGTDGHRHFFGDEMRDVRHSLPSLAYFSRSIPALTRQSPTSISCLSRSSITWKLRFSITVQKRVLCLSQAQRCSISKRSLRTTTASNSALTMRSISPQSTMSATIGSPTTSEAKQATGLLLARRSRRSCANFRTHISIFVRPTAG